MTTGETGRPKASFASVHSGGSFCSMICFLHMCHSSRAWSRRWRGSKTTGRCRSLASHRISIKETDCIVLYFVIIDSTVLLFASPTHVCSRKPFASFASLSIFNSSTDSCRHCRRAFIVLTLYYIVLMCVFIFSSFRVVRSMKLTGVCVCHHPHRYAHCDVFVACCYHAKRVPPPPRHPSSCVFARV